MMENNRRASKEKKHPRVPIKTYRWEDVRRSRKKGGYPWTYLYKQPLGEAMDPPPNQIETKVEERETEREREPSEWEELMLEEAETIEDIHELSDTPGHLKNSSSSLGVSGSFLDEKSQRAGIFFLDSAESSDDISQYLDKDEPTTVRGRTQLEAQVQTEEGLSRKRTVSENSNHSKLSLSKSVMKKIKDAKAKVKVTKLSFPTSKLRKTIPKKSNSPPKTQPSSQDKKVAAMKEVAPVYIHIPLKPPPGETDLNPENKGDSKKVQSKKRSFKDAVKGIKHLYEDQKDIATISEETTENTSKTHSDDEENTKDNQLITHQETTKDVLDHRKNEKAAIRGPLQDDKSDTHNMIERTEKTQEKIVETNLQKPPEDVPDHGKNDPLGDDTSKTKQIGDDDEDQGESSKQYIDMFDDLFKASSSVTKKEPEPRDRTMRSKSAEPERKRKMSLESAYSRKSLSKLGLLKKLKNASDKIKKAFSRPNLKQEKDEPAEVVAPEKPKGKKKEHPVVAPVYIYIPLKDENPDDEKPDAKDTDEVSTPEVDSPTPGPGKVELIILTAPSDDELLDYNSSDVPETPISENKLFFGNKITELKELAKGAIDGLPAKEKLKLLKVDEETTSENTASTKPEIILENNDDTTSTDDKLADYDPSPTSENKLKDLASTQVIPEKMETDSSRVVPEATNESTTLASQESEKESSAVAISTLQGLDPKPPINGIEQAASDTREVNTLVDEEDGLSETTIAVMPKDSYDQIDIEILETPEAAKTLEAKEDSRLELPILSNLTEETNHPEDKPESPKLKKKVSFRKKAKLMGDGSYEDVEVPQGSFEGSDAGCIAAGESEIEKLAVEAVSSPLEEDDNKWSKASDHEYEPVNPPPEDFVMIPCSTIVQTATDDSSSRRQSPDHQEHPDHDESARTPDPDPEANSEKKSGLHKFQSEFKRKAQDLKGRFHAMKKPHISLPARPVFHKPSFNIDRSKLTFQRVKNKLPSLKSKVKRHHSTESNDGDAKKTIFSTYPRIFKRKPAGYNSEMNPPDFATVPRSRANKFGEPVRIPLHPEDSVESREEDTYVRGESLEELGPSRFQYSEGAEEENGEEENEEEFSSLGRWDRGTFTADRPDNVVTDLDMPEEQPDGQSDYKDHYSSGSSNGMHRQGVLEEIDSDEFFLRQKGISQDNIEVGMYLSSEIRDAFRTPVNALSQIQHQDYTLKGSTQSIPEVSAKRKPIKKPKRKKTPHVSQERIENYEEESAEDGDEGAIPPRPKRNSRRSRKQKPSQEDLIPYQETIAMEPHDRIFEHRESLAVLGDDERDEEGNVYENGGVVGRENPEINVTDYLDEEQGPLVPPRKQKSLKSLNFSENDSILGLAYSEDVIPTLEAIRTESKIIIPIPTEVPERPRRSRSRSQINSQYHKEVQDDNEDAFLKKADDKIPYADEPEPTFTKVTNDYRNYFNDPETQFTRNYPTIQKSEVNLEKVIEPSFVENDSEHREPCVEEICKKDIRDSMGYAIIDKTKARDPPLPPPRIPKRRKKPLNNKFATVQSPNSKDKSPIRPLRNYSTLGQMRKPSLYADENEENIDITQYLEVDDAAKKLQSGDVIQKMKDRPLPPPPRPPRKMRPLHDVASEENIMVRHNNLEAEVSTQTEPLPDDFVCEEMVEEPTDTVIIPTESRKKQARPLPEGIVCEEVVEDAAEPVASMGRREREVEPSSDDFVREEMVEEPTNAVIVPTERRKKQARSLPDKIVCAEVIDEPAETNALRRGLEASTDDFSCEEIIGEPTNTVIIPTERRKKQARPLPEEIVCVEVVEEPIERVTSIGRRKREALSPSDDFVCEEIMEKPTDTVIFPTERRKKQAKPLPDDLVSVKVTDTAAQPLIKELTEEPKEAERSKREIHLITPTVYTYEETITHGSLLVEPLDSSTILPNQKERRIPVHVDSNDEETSSIPEEFNKLSAPIEESINSKETIEHDVPKPHSLQLRNLDIDTLTVNRLMADKIVVSELDAGSVRTNEISSDSGNVQVTGLNLPPELIKEVMKTIKSDQAKGDDTRNVQSHQAKSNHTTNVQSDQAKGTDTTNVESNQTKVNTTTNVQSVCENNEELARSEAEPLHPVEDINDENSQGPNIYIPVDIESSIIENENNVHWMSSLSESCGVGRVNEAFSSEEEPVPVAVDITDVTNGKFEMKDEAQIPPRPPRQSEKNRGVQQREEPEVDDSPPPRPPQPQLAYVPSQPPASFYALKAERYLESVNDVPTVPRRKRHTKSKHLSRSSSDESSAAALPRRRSHRRSSSPSLGELSSTLLRVCGGEINGALKRLVTYVLSNVPRNDEGKQDMSAMIMIVLVLIAGLILLGYGEEKTVVHLHHWDYFNPPTDM